VPVLAFTGQMGRQWRGRTVQMQIDHQRLYAPITKWSAEIAPGAVYSTLKKAAGIALAEQPGPVHLDFREDVADELSAEEAAEIAPRVPAPSPLDERAFQQAAALLRQARHPLVAFGLTMNRAGATEGLRAFVDRHRLPSVCTQMAKGHIPEDGSRFVGVVGRARRDIVAEFCKPADLVVAVGYDPIEFNLEEWVPATVPVIHIDTVPVDIAAGHPVPVQIVGDIGEALRRLAGLPPIDHGWDLEALKGHRARLRAALTPAQAAFSPHHALLAMREILPADGLLTVDVGAHTHVIAQLWDTRGPGNVLVSNGWSSMGFAIPAAIAAKLVQPHRPVVACMGDGGFLMMVGEIATAVRLRLPVVFVVLRDSCLSLIKVKQTRRQFHHDGVVLFDERYGSSQTLFGAPVVVAREEEQFRAAFAQALTAEGPVVIEAVVDPSEYEITL
ncbi:MAG: thiamine pyrophosphate-binding protein, partial [Acidobacteria bacterium]|nr:thiamine pyrophosphate-binding protein [Acidobacteriota bacterium]